MNIGIDYTVLKKEVLFLIESSSYRNTYTYWKDKITEKEHLFKPVLTRRRTPPSPLPPQIDYDYDERDDDRPQHIGRGCMD